MRRPFGTTTLALSLILGLSSAGIIGCGSESETFASGEQLVEAQKRRAESLRGEAGPSRPPRENSSR